MNDFIEVFDDVLPRDFCQQLITLFEQSPHTTAGRTGGGVDTSKKLSTDLYLNQFQEYHPALSEIIKYTTTYIADYFRKYHFALIGPVSMTVAHPT